MSMMVMTLQKLKYTRSVYLQNVFNQKENNLTKCVKTATALSVSKYTILYRGCYASFGSKDVELDLFACQQHCMKQGYSFIGIKVIIRTL